MPSALIEFVSLVAQPDETLDWQVQARLYGPDVTTPDAVTAVAKVALGDTAADVKSKVITEVIAQVSLQAGLTLAKKDILLFSLEGSL